MKVTFRYSEAFKLEVIEAYSSGKYESIASLMRAFGIRGIGTVERWLRDYGREDLLNKVIRVETVKERSEKSELKKRVKVLETSLSDAHIDCSLDRAFLEIACERLGISVEEFKKKTRIDAVRRAKDEESSNVKVSISDLCQRVNMSRQNYYKARKSRQRRKVDATYVVDRVKHVRFKHPRMGARKLLRVLSSDFSSHGIQIGRDRFFDLLREHSLLVKRRKKFARTTNSYHSLPVFHNIFKDLCLYKPNQAWVSDLTYIRVRESFIFLSLVTDAYSRKIVGYHGGDSLEAVGCIEALKMAIKDLPEGERPIHHSDRGSQYCCHAYVDILTRAGFGISMTEENHCYENALAERVNGILKDEYNLSYTFPGVQEARIAIDQAIGLYNFERPHLSLGYRTPNDIHEKAA